MKNNKDSKWAIWLVIAVAFVALVLGVVQGWSSDETVVDLISEPVVEVPVLSEFVCEDTGGEWEYCGSACRVEESQSSDIGCIEVCVEYCHCRHDGECPVGHHCDDFIEDDGVCVLDI